MEGTDRMSSLLMQHACLLTSSEAVRKRGKTWGKYGIFERDEKWERRGVSWKRGEPGAKNKTESRGWQGSSVGRVLAWHEQISGFDP